MFGKSLKYEFKAVSRKIVPLFITVLVISVLLGVTFIIDGRVLPSAPKTENPYAAERIIDLMQWILVAGLIVMIFVVSIAVFVLMLKRFYSSFFTDEGYLTFTLPVSVDCHLMTKIVSMLIWSFFSGIVTILSYLIIGGGIEIGYGVISDIADQAREVLSELGEILSLIWREYTGSVVLSFFYSVLYLIIEIKKNHIIKNPNILLDNHIKNINTIKIKLELLNPINVLNKGYSIVYKDNKVIKDINNINDNDNINILVKNGNILANVKGVSKNE